ncbi:PREDICTED: olfactory receptor 1052-like [Sturnus vulgaris]|uniref:olfactory receptor 1052-like n=1 Tax=Sturnus vulgaris TaxID=9172 RepID=UPI000719EF4F|nr:PREDICTED: olfactory receptor 1052-like [Sturnus vulgaris]
MGVPVQGSQSRYRDRCPIPGTRSGRRQQRELRELRAGGTGASSAERGPGRRSGADSVGAKMNILGTSSDWLFVTVNYLLYGTRHLRVPRESKSGAGKETWSDCGNGSGDQERLPSVPGAAAVKVKCDDVQRDILEDCLQADPTAKMEETSSKEFTQTTHFEEMPGSNCTQATEFSLAGFTKDPANQVTLFLLFLLTYLVTILGNLGMIALIRASPLLHSPMYYFLSNLAFVNLCTSTIITPRMLVGVLLGRKGMSYAGCTAQVFTIGLFLITECFLLATMAYDRYVAVCHPLFYPLVMSRERCSRLVAGSYLLGLANGVGQTLGMSSLSFCSSSTINLFFCDISLLISLSTSDNTLSLVILRTASCLLGVPTILVVLVSYVAIILTILSISPAQGKHKAFSTCASHLTTVSTFYGALIFMYLVPRSDSSRGVDKWAAVLYTVVTPMLNPLIYSLRNQEVKEAWKRLRKIK